MIYRKADFTAKIDFREIFGVCVLVEGNKRRLAAVYLRGSIMFKEGASVSETLNHKAKTVDADAFITLCAPFEGMVYRHCLQMLRNRADAQDAAQEAMLRAYRAIGSFRGGSSVATWLFRIAHNVCLDWLKRNGTRADHASLQALGEAGFEPADPRPTPEARYLESSERERLQAAIANLTIDQQTLISLRYGEGLSYEALADALRVESGTVKSRLSRVKEKLRGLLAEF